MSRGVIPDGSRLLMAFFTTCELSVGGRRDGSNDETNAHDRANTTLVFCGRDQQAADRGELG